jgi:hypothetical protein
VRNVSPRVVSSSRGGTRNGKQCRKSGGGGGEPRQIKSEASWRVKSHNINNKKKNTKATSDKSSTTRKKKKKKIIASDFGQTGF